MNSSDFKKLLQASYSGKIEDVGNWVIDHTLSGQRAQVYQNSKTNKIVIVHRGTASIQDWVTDARMALGDTSGERFLHAERIQRAAEKKYGHVDFTLGHSLGASIAEKVGKKSNRILTYNKPVLPSEIIKTIPKNQHDIRTFGDAISTLTGWQKSGNPVTTIASDSYNPLVNHSTDMLSGETNDIVGAGRKKK